MSRKDPNRTAAEPPVHAITTDADGKPAGPETDPHTAHKPLDDALGVIRGVDVPPGDLAADLAQPHQIKAPGKARKITLSKE